MNVILVLAVLKKNYTNLCHCLPQNYMKTMNKLRLKEVSDDDISKITSLPTTALINDAIVGILMVATIQLDVQALHFCDVMDDMVDSKSSGLCIKILRNGN